MSDLLDREQIIALLTELGARLAATGAAAEIYVVGGTAMVLAYDRERLTRDIDAVWVDEPALDAAVMSIAAERGLPRDWLNDRVRPMLPRVLDEDTREALVLEGLTVSVASRRHMIAMKARAAPDARDLDDLVLLCRQEGIARVEAVFAIADEVWGDGMLRDDALFAVREGLMERGLSG